jgi:hypothetical protein
MNSECGKVQFLKRWLGLSRYLQELHLEPKYQLRTIFLHQLEQVFYPTENRLKIGYFLREGPLDIAANDSTKPE